MPSRTHRLARLARLALAATLLVTLAACGGGEDDSTRQRNSALECIPDAQGNLPEGCDPAGGEQGQKLDCDAQWDPASGAVTLCADFRKIEVTQKDDKGQKIETGVAESEAGARAVQVDLVEGAVSFDVDVWTRNPAGNLRKAGSVSFEAATGAVNTFSYMPDASDETPTTDAEGDADRELVMGYDFYNVLQSVDVSGLKASDKVEFTVSTRLNPVTPVDDWLNIDMLAYDASGTNVGYASEFNFPMNGTVDKESGWSDLTARLSGGFLKNTTRIVILMKGQDKGDRSGGHKGPRITSAELRINGDVRNANPAFDDGTAGWSVRESSFMECSLTDGPRPCVTAGSFEDAFTEAPTTTTEPVAPDESTTTTEASAPEETTTTTEAPAPEETTTTTVLPPLLVEREPCSMNWVAAERSFVTCRSFTAIKVATYDAEGVYIGSVDSSGSDKVVIPEAMAAAMRWAYYSVGTDLGVNDQELPLSRAREWMNFDDPTQDGTDDFTLDPENQPELRVEADTMDVDLYQNEGPGGTVDLELRNYGDHTLYLSAGGKISSTSVNLPADDAFPWRIYTMNEFGMLSLVGAGIAPGDGGVTGATVSVIDIDALGMIRLSAGDQVLMEEGMGAVQEGAECANSQPVLFTDPNTPSRSDKVRISLDTDCTATNGIAGIVIVDLDSIMANGFWPSLVWGNFVSTRYSNRIEDTVYLPSGRYSFFFFQMFPDNFKVSGIDYAVDAATSKRGCDDPSLVLAGDKKSAVFSGCTGPARVQAYASPFVGEGDGFVSLIERDLATDGTTIDLSKMGEGWWRVDIATGRWEIAITTFAVCATSCEIAPGQAEVDTSAAATDGTVTVTDSRCQTVEDEIPTDDSTWRDSTAEAFVSEASGRAHRMVHQNYRSPQSLPVTNTVRTSAAGEMILWTHCGKSTWAAEGPVYSSSSTLSVVDAAAAPEVRPSNDDLAAALDVTGASEVEVDLLNGTREENEPQISAFLDVISTHVSTTWLSFVAPGDGEMLLTTASKVSEEFTAGLSVFRRDAGGRLGAVTSNISVANFILMMEFGMGGMEDFNSVRFNVRSGERYWVQLVSPGIWAGRSVVTLVPPTEDNWVAPSTTVGEATSTTVGEAPSTTAEPATTTTEQAQATTTTAAVPDTAPQGTDAPSVTTAPAGPVTPEQIVSEGIKEFVKEGSRNEPAPVLAPEGSQPQRIEVREDAMSVTVSMQDLVASVTKSGAVLDPKAPVVVVTGKARPRVFSRQRRSVTVPVAPGDTAQDIDVVATAADGTTVTATIAVAKTVKPLVAVGDGTDGDGGGVPVVPVVIVLLALLAAGAATVLVRNRKAGGTDGAPE